MIDHRADDTGCTEAFKRCKGVAPKHLTLNQIFAGMMPCMLIDIVCMIFMYIWPGMTLWLPNYLYGN